MIAGDATTVFLKLGGSLLTDKNQREQLRSDVLARLADEIAQACATRPDLRLLLGHGSGSFGHFAGQQYGTRQGICAGDEARGWFGYAATAAAAARLNRFVVEALLSAGLPAVAFPPSASARCAGGRLLHMAWEPIGTALGQGVLPVVHGDVALDGLQGCTIVSTEEVFAYLAGHLAPARVLIAGSVDGVFSADPHLDAGARWLPHLTAGEVFEWTGLGGYHGRDVTGGMHAKVRLMAQLAQARPSLDIRIFSGEPRRAVFYALTDHKYDAGTRITA